MFARGSWLITALLLAISVYKNNGGGYDCAILALLCKGGKSSIKKSTFIGKTQLLLLCKAIILIEEGRDLYKSTIKLCKWW